VNEVKDNPATDKRDAKWRNQEALIAAMMDPVFYPKPPLEVAHKETHISHLFFTGELVYKVKKAVRYSFLDYSTLARRRHFMSEELRLNRRLAPSVYLAAVPITIGGMGWQLGGEGEPVEYALVMRRLSEKRMLHFLLETHQVTAEMIGQLANVLAKFHAQAERVKLAEASEYPNAVEKQWNDNLTDLEPFLGTLIDSEVVTTLRICGARFIDRNRDLLMQRAKQGWIRDVHGDLHCDHVCFAPEGIQIFDCIEFSSKLRCCDLASEIAFLLMDLEVRGGEALVEPFLARYGELLPDPEMMVLLPFYKCYRALVRGKVHALRGSVDAAARYFRFAARFTWESLKPFVLIVSGLTGSGKSTLARELGERLGMPVINSDVVRKAIAEKSGWQNVAFNTGIYNPRMTEKTYGKMAQEAGKKIRSGCGVILDATFGRKAYREKIIRLADKHRVLFFVIHCVASEESTKNRLVQRAFEGKDMSDGRWEIYVEQAAAYQPLDEIPSASCLELNTESSLEQLARSSEKFLRSRFEHKPRH
jgi:uncharacterized protein